MTTVTQYQIADNVATITLQNGKVNAFSHQLIDEINAHLDDAEQHAGAVVIAGQPGMFTGGFDLKVMMSDVDSMRALVTKGSELSLRLLGFPLPVVIACTGHCMAKGALLLLSADYRIGAEGNFKIGLNEVQIGMTMHRAGMAITEGRLSANYMSRAVIHAEIFDPQGAQAAGFLDGVVPAEKVVAAAQAQAQLLTQLDKTAYRQTKANTRKDVLATLTQAIQDDAKSITGPQ